MAKLWRRGHTRAWWVPGASGIANKNAPTAAEVNAGTEITAQIGEINGWTTARDRIATPTLDTDFDSTIGGARTAADSSLAFYMFTGGIGQNPLLAVFTVDTEGFVVFSDDPGSGSLTNADDVDVFPVVVIGQSKRREMANNPAMWDAQFSIESVPVENVTLA